MKKQFTYMVGMTAALSLMVGSVALAASTPEQLAKKLADSYAPAGTSHLRTKADDGFYEILYSKTDETFEYKVSSTGTALVAFESERIDHRGGSAVTITEETAKGKVTAELPKAEILSVNLDRDEEIEYEVRFKTDTYYGEYTIHPENGTILQRDIVIGTWVSTPDGTTSATPAAKVTPAATTTQSKSTADIGAEKAKQIALKEVPGATVVKCERDYEHGALVYELELYNGRWEYDIDIDGATGTILKMEKEYDD